MDEVKELERHLARGRRERAIDGVLAVIIDAVVLVVQGTMEDPATDGFASEHTLHKRLELYIAVVEGCGNWACELDLVCLEAGGWSA